MEGLEGQHISLAVDALGTVSATQTNASAPAAGAGANGDSQTTQSLRICCRNDTSLIGILLWNVRRPAHIVKSIQSCWLSKCS